MIIADKDTAQHRYNICKACIKFNSVTTQCNECFCFMKIKVKIKTERCPLDKW